MAVRLQRLCVELLPRRVPFAGMACSPSCGALQVPGCAPEFYSYGVLHAAALGPLLLNQELGQLPRAHLEHPAVVHALATARAVRCVCVWDGRGACCACASAHGMWPLHIPSRS